VVDDLGDRLVVNEWQKLVDICDAVATLLLLVIVEKERKMGCKGVGSVGPHNTKGKHDWEWLDAPYCQF